MKNDFIDIMHDRLSQHEMIEPSGLWQDINNSLDSCGSKKKSVIASRSALYKAVAGVAAAALVAMVVWTTHNSPSKTEGYGGSMKPETTASSPSVETRHALSATTPVTVPALSPSVEKEPSSTATGPATVLPVGTRRALSDKEVTIIPAEQLANTTDVDSALNQDAPAKDDLALLDTNTTTNQADTTLTISYEPAQQFPQFWSMTEKVRKNNQKPEFALSYSGFLASAGSAGNSELYQDFFVQGDPPDNSSSNGFIPQNQESVKVDEKEEIVPIRIGFEIWYPIGEKWRVGSGLTYTRLSSKKTITYTSDNKLSLQQKHETASYLGVPVEVSRILWNRERWSFYAGAGAMIEFNLKSKLRKNDNVLYKKQEFKDKRPQFSVNTKLGLQYNIVNSLGLYLEPGVSYYFYNGADHNIYMSHPLRFEINLGFKLNLGK